MNRHYQDYVTSLDIERTEDWNSLTRQELESVFQVQMPPVVNKLLQEHDFGYRALTLEERDQELLKIIKVLDADLPVSGPKRNCDWDLGWKQNLTEYIEKGFLEEATPFLL